jgi:hypothetical protein
VASEDDDDDAVLPLRPSRIAEGSIDDDEEEEEEVV